MIKRIIFDIDYTLLVPNYYREKEFLSRILSRENTFFINNMYLILKKYEEQYVSYDKERFIKYLNNYTNEPLPSDFLEQWFEFNTELDEQDVSEIEDTLTYLSKYELVTLTNWFGEPQKKKLELLGLKKYFKEFHSGDEILKPYKASFINACGNNKPSECVMIGDNLEVDIIGAINAGLDAIHYDEKEKAEHEYKKIKKIGELKKLL